MVLPLLGRSVLQRLLLDTGEGVVGPRHIPNHVLRQVGCSSRRLFQAAAGCCSRSLNATRRHSFSPRFSQRSISCRIALFASSSWCCLPRSSSTKNTAARYASWARSRRPSRSRSWRRSPQHLLLGVAAQQDPLRLYESVPRGDHLLGFDPQPHHWLSDKGLG